MLYDGSENTSSNISTGSRIREKFQQGLMRKLRNLSKSAGDVNILLVLAKE